MEKRFTNSKETRSWFFNESLYTFRLFLGFLFAISVIASTNFYQSFQIDQKMKKPSKMYEVLGNEELLVTKGFSIKQNMMLMR